MYDIVFFVQHYILYPNRHDPALLRAISGGKGVTDEKTPIITAVDRYY